MAEGEDPQIGNLISLVGDVTVTWAIMERALDLCIHTLYHNWDADEAVTEIPRTAMNRKLEFLRTAFAEGTKLDALFPGMRDIAQRIDVMAFHRHQYVHGAANFVFEADGSVLFSRLQRTKDGLTDVVASAMPEHLVALRADILHTATFLSEFVEILTAHLADEGDEPSGERAV